MKNVRSLLFTALILGFLTAPAGVQALDLRTGSDISVASSTEAAPIEGNLYVAGGRTNVSAHVPGDLSLVSGESVITGTIDQDVTAAGGSIFITGTIHGDLRVVGGDVVIQGTVDGNTVVVGGDVRLGRDARLLGDILVVGGRVIVDAPITSYAKIVSGHVTMNSELSGQADVTTQQLILASGARIVGNLHYFAPVRLQQGDNAVISGTVNFNQIDSIRDNNIVKNLVLSFMNFWILLQFVTTLLLAFLLVYMFKVFSQRVTTYALEHFGKSLLIGIVTLLVIPLFIIIFLVSLIGLPIAILLGLMVAIVLTLSWAVAGIILGTLIQKAFKKEESFEVNFQTTTIGVILLTVLQFVPVAGEVTRFVFFLVAVGAMMRYIYTTIRFNKI